MNEDSGRRPRLSDVVPSEAGVLVRDAMRAARHGLSLGRRHLEAAPVPGADMALDILHSVARRTEDRARRMLAVALPQDRALLAADSIRTLLDGGDDRRGEARIAFVGATYRTLREVLTLMGVPRALVLEGAIEAAMAAALPKRGETEPSYAFAARFTHALIARRAIGHALLSDTVGTTDIRRQACFAVGLSMAAELGEPVAAEETGALVAAACAMTGALRGEVAAATDIDAIAALFRIYAPHV